MQHLQTLLLHSKAGRYFSPKRQRCNISCLIAKPAPSTPSPYTHRYVHVPKIKIKKGQPPIHRGDWTDWSPTPRRSRAAVLAKNLRHFTSRQHTFYLLAGQVKPKTSHKSHLSFSQLKLIGHMSRMCQTRISALLPSSSSFHPGLGAPGSLVNHPPKTRVSYTTTTTHHHPKYG